MNRGAWWAPWSPWGRKELDMTEHLTVFAFLNTSMNSTAIVADSDVVLDTNTVIATVVRTVHVFLNWWVTLHKVPYTY